MPKVFISYRRDDSANEAKVLFEEFSRAFEVENVFLDTASSPLGLSFSARLFEWICWADAIIVLIGKGWKGEKNSEGIERIHLGGDYVRKEVFYALFRNANYEVPVIPVLLNKVNFSSWILPLNIEELKSLTYFDLNTADIGKECNELIERVKKVMQERMGNKPIVPKIIDSKIDIKQRILDFNSATIPSPLYEIYKEVSRHPLPSTACLFLSRERYGYVLKIIAEVGFYDGRKFLNPDISYMNDWPIEEVVGELMEYYCATREQIYVHSKEHHPKSFFISLKKLIVGSEEEGEWKQYYGNAQFLSLHRLLIEFSNIAYSCELATVNEPIPENCEICGSYSCLGVFSDNENKVFGTYVCSVTTDLGGRNVQDKKLYVLPTAPDTQLQYLDIYNTPRLIGVNWYGHVGRNDKGYHIVFAW